MIQTALMGQHIIALNIFHIFDLKQDYFTSITAYAGEIMLKALILHKKKKKQSVVPV